ncbi:hypothetical protein GQ42DRAFT_154983 [Ramicandelaber brevisporus]|nr:hypothetical protein GQ42DRAFT_154983 [Ramicandelaber brevisporus]
MTSSTPAPAVITTPPMHHYLYSGSQPSPQSIAMLTYHQAQVQAATSNAHQVMHPVQPSHFTVTSAPRGDNGNYSSTLHIPISTWQARTTANESAATATATTAVHTSAATSSTSSSQHRQISIFHPLTSPSAPSFSSFSSSSSHATAAANAAMFSSSLAPASISLFDEAELQCRRERHNMIERRRRESMNQVIDQIRDALPALDPAGSISSTLDSDGEDADGEPQQQQQQVAAGTKRKYIGSGRVSKSKVLKRALEYIQTVQHRVALLEAQVAHIKSHRNATAVALPSGRPRSATRVYTNTLPIYLQSNEPARCASMGLPRLPPCPSVTAVMVSASQSQPSSSATIGTQTQSPSSRTLELKLKSLPPGYIRLPLPVPSNTFTQPE